MNFTLDIVFIDYTQPDPLESRLIHCTGGGGGGGGDTYDAAYNARMATIAESQQGIGEDLYRTWKYGGQRDMELEQVAANRELIPFETALSKAEIQGKTELLPEQIAFTRAQMGDSLSAMKERAPVRTAFYKEASEGVDVESRANKAAADAAHSFMNSNKIMNRNAARMGLNPNSGKFASMMTSNAIDRAKTIGGAKTQARTDAEQENFSRLTTAMNYGGNNNAV